ncbi:hypothetical protein R1flu_015035 [Riccia fluitans]|uniref:Uncharacterized protein n=1 Tax=Riccia fluitans TaxID=41844 RepID=A0ABD1YHS7_9MARC
MASAVSARTFTCYTCSSSETPPQTFVRSNRVSLPSFGRTETFNDVNLRIRSRSRRSNRGIVRMGLRAVESYDASFQLLPECEERLLALLKSDSFCVQVAEQANKGPDVKYSFTGELFQPVPWSPTTKHGMPQEYEKYLEDREQYMIINVPPNFMFQAKIFKPSRLCAVYQRVQMDQ